MSSFLDKAKVKAQQLAAQAKEKVDDYKETKKADDLLDDLGRILYRQRTDRGEPEDEAAIVGLVSQLQELEAAGAPVLQAKEPEPAPASDLPPPAAPTAGAPPPPPSAPPPASAPLPDTPLPETPLPE